MLGKKRLPTKLKPHHVRWAVLEAGASLKDSLRRRILAVGSDAVPELSALLNEPDLLERHVQHCAVLLAALDQPGHKALIGALNALPQNSRAFDIVVQTLVGLGPSVASLVEERLDSAGTSPATDSLFEILARCGARTDSIRARLLRAFEGQPGRFASFLQDYGDQEALPALERHFNETALSSHELNRANTIVKELGEAIIGLGGTLSDEGKQKLQTATALLKLQQHDLTFDFRDAE